jgi:hypothetical protein
MIETPSGPEGPPSAPRHADKAHRKELKRRRNRRAVISLVALGIVLAIGTVGFHLVAQTNAVNSFYFESMLATGQGPPFPLTTDSAKLFASGMAFLSVGTVVSALIINLGPLLGRLWREGIELAEKEIRKVEGEVADELRGKKH